MAAPSLQVMPLYYKFAAIAEKNRQTDRAEVWRIYMATVVQAYCEKSYADFMEEYDRAGMTEDEKQQEIEGAYADAARVMQALENMRGGDAA